MSSGPAPISARARSRSAAPKRVGVEPGQVDAVSQQGAAVAAGDVVAGHQLEVLDALHELGVGEARGDALGEVDRRPLRRRVVVGGVQPVDGVDHDGYPGEPAEDPAVEARLGVVGVEDVDLLVPEDAPQVAGGAQVAPQAPSPRRGGERDVPDTGRLQLGDIRAGGADPDRLPSESGGGGELRHHQVAEAQVDGGEVGDLHRPAVRGHPATSSPWPAPPASTSSVSSSW